MAIICDVGEHGFHPHGNLEKKAVEVCPPGVAVVMTRTQWRAASGQRRAGAEARFGRYVLPDEKRVSSWCEKKN